MTLSPATRQRIIERVHASGHYRAHHDGILIEIDAAREPRTQHWMITLGICIDRKWRRIPCDTVFGAVEEFNRWVLKKRHLRTEVAQGDLAFGDLP